jgi:hypothetical protein
MTSLLITQLFALTGLLVAVIGLALRWRQALSRPLPFDRSPAKGSPGWGLMYAFTLGMAPWAKESTRLHSIAYLRGIAFHVGIFAGLPALIASPAWSLIPPLAVWLFAAVIGFGALMGLAGEVMRWAEANLRRLSTPDDHASVWAVTIFMALTAAALISPAFLPAMYVAAGALLIYAPLGKIRHCIYFFFSRRFYGLFVGRRAVIHTEASQ